MHAPSSSTGRCPRARSAPTSPADVPILGLTAGAADAVRASLRKSIPVSLAVGSAAFDENADRGATAPFSSEGLSFDGGPKPEVSAPGVGLATSDPGRDEDGAARYGTLSGSSAAAALTAGAAALLAQARPDLDAGGLKQALVASARTAGGGRQPTMSTRPPPPRPSSSRRRPPSASAPRSKDTTVSRYVTLRNVSRRALDVTIQPGTADAADITVDTDPHGAPAPSRCLARGPRRGRVPFLPRAPSALGGALRVRIRGGSTLQIPWTIAVPLPKPDLIAVARLSSRSFSPSDAEPAVLTVVAGRVDGTAERPQLLPLRMLAIDLYRGKREVGRLAQIRDVLPGRYAFGITGRGPRGGRLPKGDYVLAHPRGPRRQVGGRRAARPVHDRVRPPAV